ncbi:MAG TPA: MFS transporter [Streptosporangiaceae bacterium]|nr:MFS transporter [Streptosporangiaceae bacterium]
MQVKSWRTRPARAGTAVLLAALAVELTDEVVDGTKSAALPLIRQSLALSYGQIGLLASVPLLLGSLLEFPLGVLAGRGRARRLAVLAGGVVFIITLVAAAAARSFTGLLAAFVIFFPASGAFVGLTQSGLMDADPQRREQHMARWDLSGSVGSVTGPLLLVVVLAVRGDGEAGGGWRSAYLVLAALAAAAWLAVAANPPPLPGSPGPARPGAGAAWRQVLAALGQPGVARCLVLLQVCDLLLDVLTGFLALYLVAAGSATPAQAALGVAVRLGAGLAGDAALVWALERFRGLALLRASAAAAALLYPGFLLAPGIAAKLALLAALSFATAPWYPLLQAELYGSLPDHSGVAVSLSSAASLLGGLGPLAVGFLAQRAGLGWALAVLALAPPALLAGLRRSGGPRRPDGTR